MIEVKFEEILLKKNKYMKRLFFTKMKIR